VGIAVAQTGRRAPVSITEWRWPFGRVFGQYRMPHCGRKRSTKVLIVLYRSTVWGHWTIDNSAYEAVPP